MGAVPKNKITSAERGKRRHGNKPSLKKNLAFADVPLHKKGLVAQIFQTIGLKSPVGASLAQQRQKAKKTAKKDKAEPKKAKSKSKTPTKLKPEPKPKTKQKVKPSKQRQAQVKTTKPSKQRAQDRG